MPFREYFKAKNQQLYPIIDYTVNNSLILRTLVDYDFITRARIEELIGKIANKCTHKEEFENELFKLRKKRNRRIIVETCSMVFLTIIFQYAYPGPIVLKLVQTLIFSSFIALSYWKQSFEMHNEFNRILGGYNEKWFDQYFFSEMQNMYDVTPRNKKLSSPRPQLTFLNNDFIDKPEVDTILSYNTEQHQRIETKEVGYFIIGENHSSFNYLTKKDSMSLPEPCQIIELDKLLWYKGFSINSKSFAALLYNIFIAYKERNQYSEKGSCSDRLIDTSATIPSCLGVIEQTSEDLERLRDARIERYKKKMKANGLDFSARNIIRVEYFRYKIYSDQYSVFKESSKKEIVDKLVQKWKFSDTTWNKLLIRRKTSGLAFLAIGFTRNFATNIKEWENLSSFFAATDELTVKEKVDKHLLKEITRLKQIQN